MPTYNEFGDPVEYEEPMEPISPTEADIIHRWKAAVSQFDDVVQRHMNNWGKARDLSELPQWEAESQRIAKTQAAVDTIADQLSGASNWMKSVFGLSALNLLPFVPIAAIVGSISAVVAVTYAVSSYNDELDRRWEFVKKNPQMTTQEATTFINEGGSALTSPFGDVKNMVIWIVIGGVVLQFLPGLLKGK